MTCKQIKDYLDGLLMAEPSPMIKQAVDEHVRQCPVCRDEYDAAIKTLVLLQPSTKPASTTHLKEKIMNSIMSAQTHQPVQHASRSWPWKTALAAAAALAVLALLVYPVLQTTPSYAFAQTIEATRSVESIHLRMTPVPFGTVGEIWAQFNENAELVRLRMNFPDTEDGPKDVLWENEQAHIWFHAKNCVTTVREPDILQKVKADYVTFDPAKLVEQLYEKAGESGVDVQESAQPSQPIIITAYVPRVNRKDVYTVDSKSKLLLRREIYLVTDGSELLELTTEYLDYNQVDDSAFMLDAPPDVMRVDMTEGVGIEQGAMTDEEVATKVVRQFFEAMIAKDYAKASQAFSGPPERLKKSWEKTNFTRIISIGAPEPTQETRSFRVPCKIEVQVNGKTDTFVPHGPFVRQVYGRPGYWHIHGGI